jgi:hypothetical protein
VLAVEGLLLLLLFAIWSFWFVDVVSGGGGMYP